MLLSSGPIDSLPERAVFLGELSLDGSLRHTTGILAMASVARDQGYTSVFVPSVDADEASLVEDIQVYPVASLKHLINHLRCEREITPLAEDGWQSIYDTAGVYEMDLANVRGQEHAKRASMAQQEALEVTKIYSVNGVLSAENPLVLQRLFRSPHYTISNAGLVGGGRTLRPGEITMSHRGVLFLDELPEFNHTALESLRQPLEDKVVTISRVSGSVTYPASFMPVAAMNHCPCGFHTHPRKECSCSPSTVARYQKRISGPLLDRVDVFVEVPPVEYEKLVEDQQAEESSKPRLRVKEAREVQRERFKECGFFCNSEMGPAEVWKFCKLDDGARGLLQTATQRLNLSARAFHRILKVSRTVADLEGSEGIDVAHLAEALQYRPRTAVS